nr:DUF45 domain-containing protein [Agathobacter sp.]
MAIQINADLTVTMRVPRRATKRDIQKILKEKEGGIFRKVDRRQLRQNHHPKSENQMGKLQQ